MLVLLLAIIAGRSIAQNNRHELSVRESVDYAMKNSAQVKNALIGILLQEQTNKEITASALPLISGSVEGNYYPKVPVQSFPNFISPATYQVLIDEGVKDGSGNPIVMPGDFGFIQAPFGTKYTATAGISLQQLLFDGQVFIGLQAREASIRYARSTAEVTQEQVKANIHKIYYQVVIGRRQMETIDANIARSEKLLNDTRALFQNGFAEKLDVDKVDVTLANLRTEHIKLENQLAVGLFGLKLLMGMPVKEELILTDTLSEEEIKANLLDTAYSYNDRKEFQQLTYAEQLGDFNVRRYQLSKLPTAALIGNYAKLAQRNEFNFFDRDGEWFTTALVGVKISVPIFEGLAKNARIEKARLELKQTKNNMEQLKLSIDNEVETARRNINSALVSMDYQRRNMTLSENVYNQTKLKYEQGLGSNLEITTAQTEMRTAQTNYYTSLYDAVIARIDYLKATGKL